jgi:hypothetical protein
MLSDLAIRFVLGGAIVSAFSVVGEIFKPKTFSGVFGAAPSVAIATLSLGFVHEGPRDVAVRAAWLAVATVAMFAYCVACARLTRVRHLPEWIVGSASWLVWFAVAALVWIVARGALPR